MELARGQVGNGPLRLAHGHQLPVPRDGVVAVASLLAGLLRPGGHLHLVQHVRGLQKPHAGLHRDPEHALLLQKIPAHAHRARGLSGRVHEQVEGVRHAQFPLRIQLAGQDRDLLCVLHAPLLETVFPNSTPSRCPMQATGTINPHLANGFVL